MAQEAPAPEAEGNPPPNEKRVNRPPRPRQGPRAEQGDGGRRGPMGGRPGGPGFGGPMDPKRLQESAKEILAAYDTNQDGVLDATETEFMTKDFEEVAKKWRLYNAYRQIKRIDTDGDFVITEDEQKAFAEKRRTMGPPQDRGPRTGANGRRAGRPPKGEQPPEGGDAPQPPPPPPEEN